jgi:hypothetical protein
LANAGVSQSHYSSKVFRVGSEKRSQPAEVFDKVLGEAQRAQPSRPCAKNQGEELCIGQYVRAVLH